MNTFCFIINITWKSGTTNFPIKQNNPAKKNDLFVSLFHYIQYIYIYIYDDDKVY